MPVRIFLLDDHEIVRRGLRELFEAQEDFEVVGEASNAEEAMTRVPPTRPDVAVLDVRLPGASGIEVCRDLRAAMPELRCLMLTSFADDDALFSAVLAGASGYLLKQIRGPELVTAVRRVAEGQSLIDPALTAGVMERLRGKQEDERIAKLSPQERRILDLIAEGKTNRQIGDGDVPGRENGQKLRVQPAPENGFFTTHGGGRLRDSLQRWPEARELTAHKEARYALRANSCGHWAPQRRGVDGGCDHPTINL